MDHVERFDKWKKKVEDHKESRKRDRWLKKMDRRLWNNSSASTTPPSSEAYRVGWDRIFGKKEQPPAPDGCQEEIVLSTSPKDIIPCPAEE